MNNLHTHYDTLMVSRNASAEVIRAAFKSLSQKYHPDKNNHPDADRIMQQFNESYKILSDPIARSKYDRSLSEYERKSNDENKHDYARTNNGSERQNKVVVINIPESISLSAAKEKLREFSSNLPDSKKTSLKALEELVFQILIAIVIITIIILAIAFLTNGFDL